MCYRFTLNVQLKWQYLFVPAEVLTPNVKMAKSHIKNLTGSKCLRFCSTFVLFEQTIQDWIQDVSNKAIKGTVLFLFLCFFFFFFFFFFGGGGGSSHPYWLYGLKISIVVYETFYNKYAFFVPLCVHVYIFLVSLNIFYFISAEKGLGISYYNIIYALSLQFTDELYKRHRWR